MHCILSVAVFDVNCVTHISLLLPQARSRARLHPVAAERTGGSSRSIRGVCERAKRNHLHAECRWRTRKNVRTKTVRTLTAIWGAHVSCKYCDVTVFQWSLLSRYKLAENVDAQLKRMSQDLKEIIEHLNTSSGPGDTTDPVCKTCSIFDTEMLFMICGVIWAKNDWWCFSASADLQNPQCTYGLSTVGRTKLWLVSFWI